MSSAKHAIRIAHLYAEYLNIYADRGNIMVLAQRCRWRGVGCEIVSVGLGDTFEPDAIDLIYIGGGQDRDQRRIAERMQRDLTEPINAATAAGAVVLAVCGGYQLLGREYVDAAGTRQPGIGLLDITTAAGTPRIVGNAAISCELPAAGAQPAQTVTVAGFENHAGRTTLGPDATPFGTVLNGGGNDGKGNYEGCRKDRIIGTYLHGPLLPRNPEFADWLIAAALDRRYADDAPQLAALEDHAIDALALDARTVSLARARAERH